MGYDDRVYGDGGNGGENDNRPGLMARVRAVVSGVRAAIGLILALPVLGQVIILLLNYTSARAGRPLDLPSLISWDEAARLLRDALTAMTVGGY
jgi:hypothetical protein